MELNGEKIGPDATFMYMTVTQAAIRAHELGLTEETFLDFCKGIWESMLLSNPQELKQTLSEFMLKDAMRMMNE